MGKLKPKSGDSGKGKLTLPSSTTSTNNSQLEPPVFCLRYLTKGYSLSDCQKEEKAAFADTLERLSNLTWSQIFSAGRRGCGFEKISRSSIKSSVPPHVTDDVVFIAFRFCAKAPMVGYREDSIFRIVWIDRDFTLYDHG